ncbi:predicted protein [Botrytis cinerea T4]|uniref:Uncharacterized protein n=1 Tax=Botryotinia fuckeliana (strain T4) TaxID=999810 RepID=G2YUL2_BOTF4|nr:predicted protein [Botrytis cinerea T4]
MCYIQTASSCSENHILPRMYMTDNFGNKFVARSRDARRWNIEENTPVTPHDGCFVRGSCSASTLSNLLSKQAFNRPDDVSAQRQHVEASGVKSLRRHYHRVVCQ